MTDETAERQQVLKRLYIATILCSCFLIVEVVGGILSNSLAILSDAAHLFSDIASFAVAIAASYLASLPATVNHTYGMKRTESLAALFSMVTLAFVSVGLSFEAVQRLINPPENIDGQMMSIVAGIGVAVNVALAFVLGEHHVHLPGGGDHDHDHDHEDHDHHDHDHHDHHDHEDHDHHDHHSNEHSLLVDKGNEEKERQRNVNLHAAYLHVMGDLAQSVAVFLGGIVIYWKPEYHIVDPLLTLGFSALVLCSTVGVLRTSVAVLLEETPANIDWRKVYDSISALPNINDVHDLHIWNISHGKIALSVHCTSSDKHAISVIHKTCKTFGIEHTTIQVNLSDCDTCTDRSCCVQA